MVPVHAHEDVSTIEAPNLIRVGRQLRIPGAAIQACLAVVDAQREYWRRNPQNSPIWQYARKISSTKGKRDGLYWAAKPDEQVSPLSLRFAETQRQGYVAAKNVVGRALAMVQKYFTPSMTWPPAFLRMAVSTRKVNDWLTAGSLPQLPKSLPYSTTSRK